MTAPDAARRAAVGVFDSGLGGLTVAKALMRRLPGEALLYVGDTARVPYGPKSPETVRRYAAEIADWLVGQGVKAIVVACNTATAHALEHLQATSSVPVIGVVAPGARAAVARARERVGVIGTAGTIASGAYERAIRELAPDVELFARACPLLVPLVEEGWIDHEATRLVVHEYLAPLRNARLQALVLGCTHYPLLASVIAAEMGDDVVLIDSAEETAAETARVLAARGLLAAGASTAEMRFVASDAPERFLDLARRFLGEPIAGVEHVPFG